MLLSESAEETKRSAKKSRLLTDLTWQCGGLCQKDYDYKGYLSGLVKGDAWYKDYWQRIVAPGPSRCWLACSGGRDATVQSGKCDLCGVTKSKNDFPKGMWHHRADPNQRTLCNDCARPRCTAAHCKTCPICRNEECTKTTRRSRCADPIQSLHAKQLPTDIASVNAYLCRKCRYITCTYTTSTGRCGRQRPKPKGGKKFASPPSTPYVCGYCLTLAVSVDNERKYGSSNK